VQAAAPKSDRGDRFGGGGGYGYGSLDRGRGSYGRYACLLLCEHIFECKSSLRVSKGHELPETHNPPRTEMILGGAARTAGREAPPDEDMTEA